MSDHIDVDSVTYGIDQGSPDGDQTALTIKVGDNFYNFVGDDAEAIIDLITSQRKEAELAGRIDELLSVCEESIYDYRYNDIWKAGAACLDKGWIDDRIAELQAQANISKESRK